MLTLRRAQLEQELDAFKNQLLEVEARLRYIAGEDAMPADDIMVKKIPALGVVAIGAPAPGYETRDVVVAVNQSRVQFDQLGILEQIRVTGPFIVFFEDHEGKDITVYLARPVDKPPTELPAPATYLVLPEIEAAVAVRSGPAASIFPGVYHDLVQWASAHGYQTSGPGRDVWINEVDDISQVDQQVFEVQLPFTRPATGQPG